MQMNTEVYRKHPTRFTMFGSALPQDLQLSDESISAGLAARLYRYACQCLEDAGFENLVQNSTPSVYTLDSDRRPADRSYCVRFTNPKGGYIELIGILTHKGWPSLNHGLAVGQD